MSVVRHAMRVHRHTGRCLLTEGPVTQFAWLQNSSVGAFRVALAASAGMAGGWNQYVVSLPLKLFLLT